MKHAILAAAVFLAFFALATSSFSDNNTNTSNPNATNPIYKCYDNTIYGSCSENKPFYCQNGVLRMNCSLCGCSDGYGCIVGGYCIKMIASCTDGTLSGNCSAQKPLYCHNGNLVENCSVCGCDAGACSADGTCYENHPPVLGHIGNKEVKEGELLEFTVNASDQDGDYVTLFVTGLPPGSEFNRETGKFSWAPRYNQTGNYWVTFFAVDDAENPLAGQETIRITVGEVNRPPEIEPVGDKKTDENILLEFTLQASDPDGGKLFYSAEGLPAGAKFGNETGRFSWVPAFGQEGNYRVKFTVSDGKLNVSMEITITVGDVNRLPVAVVSHPIQNQEFPEGGIVLFSAAGSYDPDGDKLTYVWNFGDGETATTESQTLEHVYKTPGKYNISLVVSDGKAYDTEGIGTTVKESVAKDGDGDGVDDAHDKCPDTPPLKNVNIYGCTLPKYTNFENNLTTDFSKVDLINASDITIGVTDKAKIEFRQNAITLVGENLDKYIEIGNMSIAIKSEIAPELNKSAVITFYNVTLENPIIIRNTVYCADCKIISYEDRTFIFSVPHFTRFSLLERASYSGYCGDGICSLYESCDNCVEDCGECKGGVQPPKACQELWVCSAWSPCNELNLRTRECTDVNICGIGGKKPAEALECGKEGQDYSFIVFSITIMILVVAYLLAENYRKRKENKKMSYFELEKFVKGYMYRGYTAHEIRKMLEEKGYPESEINKVIKQVEKQIF